MELPPKAATFLVEQLGPGTPPLDARLEDVLSVLPDARLKPAPLLDTSPLGRLLHARGQSFPDWVSLRSGRVGPLPDAVACPETEADVRWLIRFAKETGTRLIPYGGGTSVVGHVNPPASGPPVVSVDLVRMSSLLGLDPASQLARFGAGVKGPDLEAALRARGFTLGHFPQSFELSTLGGWIATRSSGQQSLGYGRIERLFAGGRLETPAGPLNLPVFPASAAGPDLKEIVLGSEGRLGILTEATIRVTPLPEREEFRAFFFSDWEKGLAAVRAIAQARLPLSMLRLSTPGETATSLLLAGHEREIELLERYLAVRGIRGEKCLLLAGLTGYTRVVRTARRELKALARRLRGVSVGTPVGRAWERTRFRAPYLRNALWEMGYGVDTLETAIPWSRLPATRGAVEAALLGGLSDLGERVHVVSHLSHVYTDGTSLYTTYLFRLAPDPDESLRRWRSLKSAASRAIVETGGTISHQHGVGTDHLPWIEAEKGALGLSALGALCRALDPDGLMNPGKLLP